MLRDENRPAAHPAGIEIVECLLEVLEPVPSGVQGDLALGGKGHELLEVVVGADEISDEVDLGGDHVDRRDVDVLAVPET